MKKFFAVLAVLAIMIVGAVGQATPANAAAEVIQFKTVVDVKGVYTTKAGSVTIKIGYQKKFWLGSSRPAEKRTRWVRVNIQPDNLAHNLSGMWLETCDVRMKLGKLYDERRRYVDAPWCVRPSTDKLYGTVNGPWIYDTKISSWLWRQ